MFQKLFEPFSNSSIKRGIIRFLRTFFHHLEFIVNTERGERKMLIVTFHKEISGLFVFLSLFSRKMSRIMNFIYFFIGSKEDIFGDE